MARRQTPSEWQELMEQAGVSSIRQLADRMGYVHTGVTRVVHGDVTPNDETVSALAEALGVELETIYKLIGNSKAAGRYWQPPAEVHRLTKREQDAVAEIIRVLAASKEAGEAGEGNAQRTPSITEGDELAKRRRDLTQHEIDTLPHVARKPVEGIEPDEDPIR